jgi:hypothetical protein
LLNYTSTGSWHAARVILLIGMLPEIYCEWIKVNYNVKIDTFLAVHLPIAGGNISLILGKCTARNDFQRGPLKQKCPRWRLNKSE